MNETNWVENFLETRQDILEDAFLLDALALYASSDAEFMRGEQAEYFPQVFRRLCGYLAQHALDLHRLGRRL